MNVRTTAVSSKAGSDSLSEDLSQLEMALTVLWNSARRWNYVEPGRVRDDDIFEGRFPREHLLQRSRRFEIK